MKRFWRCIGVSLYIFYTLQALGQEVGGRASQYYLGREDELLIPVNIWGFVKNPGQYMVPNNTDLISLLSYAGGPTENARLSTIQIVRSDPRRGSQVWRVDVKRYLETADPNLIPSLKPGDTIVVRGTSFYWVTKFFEFISRLAVFAQIYYFFVLAESYRNR